MADQLMMKTLRCLLVSTGLLLAGCADSGPASGPPVPTPKAAPLGAPAPSGTESMSGRESGRRVIGGIRFVFPKDWEERTTTSSVLLAEYQIPGSAGPCRLTFSTAGGGQAENLKRWKQQFQRGADDPEPIESSLQIAGKSATLIELSGVFMDMFGGGGSKADWRLLGAAIPLNADHDFYIKLTGPRQTLESRRGEFLEFLKSAEP